MGGRDRATPLPAREGAGGRLPGKRIALGCVLAWLLPGAGHLYLGRKARAAVFFALVTGSFLLGALLNGRFSLADRRQPILSRLQVVACLGTGPIEILARAALYGRPVYRMPAEDNVGPGEPLTPRTAVGRILRARHESVDSAFGTAYLWTAGLMNLLLILDVFDIGIGRKS